MKRATKKGSKRPYTTDYGATQGHCETPRGAIGCAIRHCLKTGRKHVVIERPHGPSVDVWFNGFWGISVVPRKASNVVKLRRVA